MTDAESENDRAPYISRRPSMALEMVTSSANSRSLPTGNAHGDARHLYSQRLQQARQVDRRGFAFHRGIGGHDDFLNFALSDPLHQALDLQRFRPDAAQRRKRAVQHVVAALELARGFDAHDVVRLFHHADHLGIAVGVAAVTAQIALADVVAHAAQAELVLHFAEWPAPGARHLRARRAAHETRCAARTSARCPGRRLNSVMRRASGSAKSGIAQNRPGGNPMPPSMPPIFCWISSSTFLTASLCAATNHVLQHLDVAGHLGLDLHREQVLLPVHGHRHHAAAGRGFHLDLRDLLLQLLLHLLRLAHHLLHVAG